MDKFRDRYTGIGRFGSAFGSKTRLSKVYKGSTLPEVEQFLQSIPTYSKFQGPSNRKSKTKYVVSGIDQVWEADLAYVPNVLLRQKTACILVIVDVLSGYSWLRALKDKNSATVAAAFRQVFESTGRMPSVLRTDEGVEFVAGETRKLCNELDIYQWSTKSSVTHAHLAGVLPCF